MALFNRKRQRKPLLPLNKPKTASNDKENGARPTRGQWCNRCNIHTSRILFLRKHCRTITLCLLLSLFMLRRNIRWMYRNRYLFLNCPEVGLWLRQPFDDWSQSKTKPHILYLTAKFGPTNGTFADAIQNQVEGTEKLNVLPAGSEIISYTDLPQEFLHDPTWKQHVDSLYGRIQLRFPGRGGGYWFWKPLLLKRHLAQLQDGDFLVYSDADMLDFFSWLPLLLESMIFWNSNLALYQLPYLEQEWTKRDVYEELCPSLNIETDVSGQYAGGHLILRKDASTLELIDDWIDLMKDYHKVSDEPSTIPNIAVFKEHRHDQSLLSLLLKCKYKEPGKRLFPWTCLQTWTLQTFRIE